MRGRKWAICIQARSRATERPGIDGVPAPEALLDVAGVGCPLHANGRRDDPALVDGVDHAHVGRLGNDQLGGSAEVSP